MRRRIYHPSSRIVLLRMRDARNVRILVFKRLTGLGSKFGFIQGLELEAPDPSPCFCAQPLLPPKKRPLTVRPVNGQKRLRKVWFPIRI